MKRGDDLWRTAASFAARAHRNQVRKDGTTPYAAHPFRVAMTVRDTFGFSDPVCLAAALLHDVLEDTPHDYEDIAEEFGTDVAGIVAALTKDMRLPESRREAEYDAALARADWRARLIKLADVLDNLADIGTARNPDARAKQLARCDRALRLTDQDAGAHPEIGRGRDAVHRIVAEISGASR